MAHDTEHPLAGKTVRISSKDGGYNGRDFTVQDWFDRLVPVEWKLLDQHPQVSQYSYHVGSANLPADEDVVYGKAGLIPMMVHTSELTEE
jgi:hypothetical protein